MGPVLTSDILDDVLPLRYVTFVEQLYVSSAHNRLDG